MASTIILSDNGASSGSAGLKSTAGNDGVLILQTTTSGGTATNAVYIDNSQQVLLGPTSDLGLGGTGKFQIAGTASTQAWVARYSNDTGGPVYKLFKSRGTTIGSNGLVQNGDTVGSISFDVANGSTYNQTAQILVGVEGVASATSTPSNMIFSTTAAGSIVASESLRLNSVGTVILKGGSTSATGVGITFPATQSASTDANTLDDYEEGTFSAVLQDTSGHSSSTNVYGSYTKIGNLVNIQFSAEGFQRPGSFTAANNLMVGGLPFPLQTPPTSAYNYPLALFVNFSGTNVGGGFGMSLRYETSTTMQIQVQQANSTSDVYTVKCSDISTSAGTYIRTSFTYRTA